MFFALIETPFTMFFVNVKCVYYLKYKFYGQNLLKYAENNKMDDY